MRIRLLTFDECPSGPEAHRVLQEVLDQEGLSVPIERVEIPDIATACREGFLGSPSIQIDGLDIEESRRGDQACHGCRLYRGESVATGVPPRELIRSALRRASGPKMKVLFLCTGNSCRSQMAEGWARALKGDVIQPYSAGVETHGLNPNAVRLMAEAGVDIGKHQSKTVEAVRDVPFDYVVTVCGHANENCPMWLGQKSKVVHVGFDDPPTLAKAARTEEEALAHYRRVRDEIRAFVQTLPESLTGRTEP